jgi:hypothetical protein
MPETRYETIETYDNKGKLIATEQIPYEVPDDELEREEAENVVAELSALSDAELTTDQLRKLVRALARLRR